MKEILSEIRKGFFGKKHFVIRLVAVFLAVIIMGFSLSLLLLVDLGVDPCTLMNVSVAGTIGISLGNWQALFNSILFIVVIILGARNLGFGTLANMFLVGYAIDFFSWIWSMVLPEGLFESWIVKIVVLIPALIVFVFAAAVYMDMDMGTAPYDAIPVIVSKRMPKIPFSAVRIAFDGIVAVIGIIFGGRIGLVTILMVLTLGPVIAWVGKKINEKWDFSDGK